MYTPLYIKTDNSLEYSLITIKKLVEYATKNNIKSLTITDTNMYGVMDFYHECINHNIKPIVGLEIKFNNNKFILYAKKYDGYKNLIKLSTIQSEREINFEELSIYNTNLICITPYILYSKLNNIYDCIYISYKNINEYENIKELNKIYCSETLYLDKNDLVYVKYLKAIKDGVTIDNADDFILGSSILNEEEYKYNDIEINKKICNLCNLEIPFNQDLMPKYINDLNMDSYSYLKKMCIEGLKKKFGTTIGVVYKDRLKYELDIINKMGFCDYFLIVSDYVNYAKNNNIIVGTGRGSAVGSLVSYLLNITDVDPLKYNLIFERFLNPERVSMPDIDIDFEHEKRGEVINYCINKYGSKKVVPIITFGTMGAKQAIRDVGKCMNIELGLIDNLCKYIDPNKSLIDNYMENDRIKELLSRKSELKKCFNISQKFEGLKRHTSIHAAGVIMSNVNLDEVIPLDKSHDFYVSGYDMTYLEKLGLLKMDFLAIKYLTTIHDIIDSINSTYNLNITFDNIPINDVDTLKIFNRADTIGIFQFESDGMINFLSKLKVNSLDDLFAAIALFRPGPMKNIDTYIRRKNGLENVVYIHPSLKEILKPTYGIMIYQEQIMQIARVVSNYTLGEADILRKAMSKKKKDILLKEREKFTLRALKNGYDQKTINDIFDSMLKFAEYGFNKSHSIAYSIIAFKMAYLKAHYPKNFITYLLSQEVSDESKIKKYIYEAKKYGINILKPDINLSDKKYIIEENGIRFPLSNIRNIGIQGIDLIIKERLNEKYTDIFDFVKKCYGKSITKKSIESLIYAGAFSSFGYNKRTLINNLDLIINYGELIKDLELEYALSLKPVIEIYPEYDKSELFKQELDIFGMYLTENPITTLKEKYKNIIDLNNKEEYFDKNVSAIINVDKINKINTSKGDKMSFITGSDELSQIDMVLFPNVYEKNSDIKECDIILVNGKMEKRFDKFQLVVNNIKKLL